MVPVRSAGWSLRDTTSHVSALESKDVSSILTNVCIPRVGAQIEMSSISRIDSCLCRNIEIVNVVSNVEVTFHYFRKLDTATSIILGVFDDIPSIM